MLKQLIEKYFKVWGVQFETDLPPEFVISKHAEQRFEERLGCSKDKMAKVAVKAWSAPEPDLKKWGRKIYNYSFKDNAAKIHYREHMGFLFVFAVYNKRMFLPAQKLLITLMN